MSTTPVVTKLINAAVTGFAVLALVSGCTSTSTLAQNAKGSVYLEEIMDWSFEASHPAVIDQVTLMKVIKGVYTAEDQNGSSRMSASS